MTDEYLIEIIDDNVDRCVSDWIRDCVIDVALNFNHHEINEYLMNRTKLDDYIIKFFFNNRDKYKIEDYAGSFEVEILLPIAEVMAEKFVICGCLPRTSIDKIWRKILFGKNFKSRELKQLKYEFN